MPKAKKPPRATPSNTFASAVREHMQSTCPSYRFVDTAGGSGPLVRFRREAAHSPLVSEYAVFQKGLHGASWFRVNFYASVAGEGAHGPLEHIVLEGAKLGPDVQWSTDAELDTALATACARLDAAAQNAFANVEEYAKTLVALFGDLTNHYVRFLRDSGAQLPRSAFLRDDGNPPIVPAFDAWMQRLQDERLVPATDELDLKTPLWRFWHNGRPMREADYAADDHYDCSKCAAFVAFKRGVLVPHDIAGFGTHHAFVCNKHRKA